MACNWCGLKGDLLLCSRCNNVFYCSEQHQRADFEQHQNNCTEGEIRHICMNDKLVTVLEGRMFMFYFVEKFHEHRRINISRGLEIIQFHSTNTQVDGGILQYACLRPIERVGQCIEEIVEEFGKPKRVEKLVVNVIHLLN